MSVLTFSSVHWSACYGGFDGCVLIELVTGDCGDLPSTRPNNRLNSLPSAIWCDCDFGCIESVIGLVPMSSCDRANHASTSQNDDASVPVWSDRRREQVLGPFLITPR